MYFDQCLILTFHFTSESSTLWYHEVMLQPLFNLMIKGCLVGVQGLDHCIKVISFLQIFVAKILTF